MEYKKIKLGNDEIEILTNIDESEIEKNYYENTLELKEELNLANQILENTLKLSKDELNGK